jgi:hypothetical protein
MFSQEDRTSRTFSLAEKYVQTVYTFGMGWSKYSPQTQTETGAFIILLLCAWAYQVN